MLELVDFYLKKNLLSPLLDARLDYVEQSSSPAENNEWIRFAEPQASTLRQHPSDGRVRWKHGFEVSTERGADY